MTRILRILTAAAAFAALTLNMAHAQGAATVTFNDPNCASWGMTQSGSSFTLTCQSLSCTISADKPAPLPTDGVTLTANCPGASSWAWSKLTGPAGCPAIPSGTASAALAAPGAEQLGCVYRVNASHPTNGGGSANITLNFTTAPPASPSGCSVAFTQGSASMPNAGGPITMVGSCTGNVSGSTTYAWTKGGSAFGSGTTLSDTVGAGGVSGTTTTYAFQATNPGAPTTNTQQLVNVAGSGGGGGAFDLSGCTSAGYVGRGLDVTYPIAGNTSIPNGASAATPSGTFGNNDALVVRFTTPAAGVNDLAVFQPAGNPPAQNTGRVYTLSTQPCQFATSNVPTGSILNAVSSQSPAITVKIATCPYTGAYVGYCYSAAWLQPNTTYYITMVNRTTFGGAGSCGFGSCDMRIDFNQ